jgi:hypothetical protein
MAQYCCLLTAFKLRYGISVTVINHISQIGTQSGTRESYVGTYLDHCHKFQDSLLLSRVLLFSYVFTLLQKFLPFKANKVKLRFTGISCLKKLSEIFNLRITPTLKEMVDKISNDEKKDLNRRIRIEIARSVHQSKFNPSDYLEEEGE